MAINDGQKVDAQNSNAAFVSKTVNSDVIGIPSLKNNGVGSGAHVENPQKAINKAFDTAGIAGENDANAKVYANNNVILNGDNHKTAIEKLDNAVANIDLTTIENRLDDIESNASSFGGDKTFSDNVTIVGNLTVNGTQTVVNSTDMQVADKNILVNKDGNDASAEGAGLDVQRTSDNGAIRFDSGLDSKFKIGLLSNLYEILVSGIAQTISGVKTFSNELVLSSWLQLNGLTSGNIKLKVPATITTHDLVFPSTQGGADTFLKNDGSGNLSWNAPGGGSALTVQDEGSNLSTAVTKINFAGAGVVATQPVANEILVTIPGGGGGGLNKVSARAFKVADTNYTATEQLILNNSHWDKSDPQSILDLSTSKLTIPNTFTGTVRVKVTSNFGLQGGNTFLNWRTIAAIVRRVTPSPLLVGFSADIYTASISGGTPPAGTSGSPTMAGVCSFEANPLDTFDIKFYTNQAITTDSQGFINWLLVEIEQI